MNNKRYIDWLYQELPKLVEKGILTPVFSEKLQKHYGSTRSFKTNKTKNLDLLIFGIIGTFLISSGIILLIAYNWSQMSRFSRTLISFFPLFLALLLNAWVMFKKKKLSYWVESSSIFWMISIAISIALISQTYHIPGNFTRFLLVWMLLSLPIIYLQNTSIIGLAYLCGITRWITYAKQEVVGSYLLIYWLLFLLIIPFISKTLKKTNNELESYAFIWLSLICIGLGLSATTLNDWIEPLHIVLFGGFFSAVYLSKNIFPQSDLNFKNPFAFLGGISVVIMGMILSFRDIWELILDIKSCYRIDEPITNIYFPLTVAVLFFIISTYLIFYAYKHKVLSKSLLGLFILPCSSVLFLNSSVYIIPLTIIFNAFLFSIALNRIIIGIKEFNFMFLNTGLVILSILTVLRFFDLNLPLNAKGFIFISIGVSFLVANFFISKKKKSINA